MQFKRLICIILCTVYICIPIKADVKEYSGVVNKMSGVENCILDEVSLEILEITALKYLKDNPSDERVDISIRSVQKHCKAVITETINPFKDDTLERDKFIDIIMGNIQNLYTKALSGNDIECVGAAYFVVHAVHVLKEFQGIDLTKIQDIVSDVDNNSSKLQQILQEANKDELAELMEVTNIDEDYWESTAQNNSSKDAVNILETFLQKVSSTRVDAVTEIKQGQAWSATYIPFRSTVNDTIDISEEFSLFNRNYGDLRKALYINQGVSDVSTYITNNTYGAFKIATLRDLIENVDDDKMLIVDPHYYAKDYLSADIEFKNDTESPVKYSLNDNTDVSSIETETIADIKDTEGNDLIAPLKRLQISNNIEEAASELFNLGSDNKWIPYTKQDYETALNDFKDDINDGLFTTDFVAALENTALLLQDINHKSFNNSEQIKSYITGFYALCGDALLSFDKDSFLSKDNVAYIFNKNNWSIYAKAGEPCIFTSKSAYSEMLNYLHNNTDWDDFDFVMSKFAKNFGYLLRYYDNCVSNSFFETVTIDSAGKSSNFLDYLSCNKNTDIAKAEAAFVNAILEDDKLSLNSKQKYLLEFADALANSHNTVTITEDERKDLGIVSIQDLPSPFNNIVDFETINWFPPKISYAPSVVIALAADENNTTWEYIKEQVNVETSKQNIDAGQLFENITKLLKGEETENINTLLLTCKLIETYFTIEDLQGEGGIGLSENRIYQAKQRILKALPQSFQDVLTSTDNVNKWFESIGNKYQNFFKTAMAAQDEYSQENDALYKLNNYRVGEVTTGNITEYHNMKSFWDVWKLNDFPYKITQAQVDLITCNKSLQDLLEQAMNTEDGKRKTAENTNINNSFVGEWLGIAFAVASYSVPALSSVIVNYSDKPIYRSTRQGQTPDCLYNYTFLRNIAKTYPIQYRTSLDMDSPLYVDIYGNIITESGVVVIPYACNATLTGDAFTFLTSGWLSTYGEDKQLVLHDDIYQNNFVDIYEKANLLANYFEGVPKDTTIINPDGNLNPIGIDTADTHLDISKINTYSSTVKSLLYKIHLNHYTKNVTRHHNHIYIANVLFQILRGSTLDKIDYTSDTFKTAELFDEGSVRQASRFEELIDNISGISENSVLTVPDLQSIPGVEYFLYFFYKLLLIAYTVYVLFQIYATAMHNSFGVMIPLKLVITLGVIVIAIAATPIVMKYSYYYLHRTLLQDEAETVVMLNEEKRSNGIELGVKNARNAEIRSEMALRVTDVNIEWYNFFKDIIYADDVTSMSELYQKYTESTLESGETGYYLKSDALYYNVTDLFKTSTIVTDSSTSLMKQYVEGSPAISYRLPYYAILDYLIYNINSFNSDVLNSYNYTQQYTSDATLQSIGLTKRYFQSNAFNLQRDDILNGDIPEGISNDILNFALNDKSGVFAIYGQDSRNIFTEPERLQESLWFGKDMSTTEIAKLSAYLDREAVSWVTDNQDLLGRVSDSTFLKTLALHLSLAYNSYMQVPGPTCIEIETMATEDLLRLCVANRYTVLLTSPDNFAKFTLDISGLPGIYVSSVLYLELFIISLVKPIFTVIIFITSFIALVIFKILLRRKTSALAGFFKANLFIGIVNTLYALLLKSVIAATFGLPSLWRMLLMVIIHVLFIGCYIWIADAIIRNPIDLGNARFNTALKLDKLVPERFKHNSGAEELYEKLHASDKYRKG